MPDPAFAKYHPHPGKPDAPPGNPAPTPSDNSPSYTELHVTTNFTFLTGASHPDEFAIKAASLGHAAVAITDRHSLAGVVRAHVAAKEAKIQLIVGARIELSFSSSFGSPEISNLKSQIPSSHFSLLLYPTSLPSYSNLSRLLTLGKRRAPKGECHLTLHDCLDHHAGLLAIIVPPFPAHGDFVPCENFINLLSSLRAVFDDDRLSLAARRLYTSEDHRTLEQLATLSRHTNIPLVATNDVHYHDPARRALQDVVTCIRHTTSIPQAGQLLFQHGERYLKPASEMSRLFAAYPEAIARTISITRRCASFSLDQVKYEYPEEICPKGRSPMAYLRELTWQGAAQRFGKPFDQRGWYEPHVAPTTPSISLEKPQDARVPWHPEQNGGTLTPSDISNLKSETSSPSHPVTSSLRHSTTSALPKSRTLPLWLSAPQSPNAPRYQLPPDTAPQDFVTIAPTASHSASSSSSASSSEISNLKSQIPPAPASPHFVTPSLRHSATSASPSAQCLVPSASQFSFSSQIPPDVIARIEHEFALIEELNYAKYFLTVYDIVAFARSQNILCQGRGAAANSAVCYCLGITSVDPSRIDLLFERFISKERGEPPDIDIDFEHERREEVIQYIYKKYGRHRAALVAEVISYRGRSAVREVGKALGLSLDLVDRMAKELSHWSDGPPKEDDLRAVGLDPRDRTILLCIELTRQILGFPRHLSQHVGGFIIAQQNLSDLVPIENAAMADRTVIEWDKDDVDAMGMLKIDCLGLGMLSCIRKSLDLYNAAPSNPQPMQMHQVPREDPVVYDMMCAADTVGVFQIESRAQMSMLPRLRPRKFYDLVIEVAIVRPGPIQGEMVHPYLRRRNGEEPTIYPTEEIKKVLGKTLGVPLFQEQAMKLAIVAAGFTPGEADSLRRAMAAWKRKGHRLLAFEDRFVGGMLKNGYEPDFANRCFQQLKGFSEYGFPESHAASFALLVYVSAWLKKHHPAIFCAALINSLPMGFYAPAQLVRDAREHGVEARDADVNFSTWDCTLEYATRDSSPALRLGMRLVKSLHQLHADAIVAAVKSRGPFTSIESLWRASRVPVSALRALARADAFRSMKLDRRQALWHIESLRDNPLPLFDSLDIPDDNIQSSGAADLPTMPLSRHVVQDYQTLGLSLKAHPLSFYREELSRRRFTTAAHVRSNSCPSGTFVRIAGMVLVRQRPSTASGVLFMTIEDETGAANLILWPNIYERYRRAARLSSCIAAIGKVERQGEVVHVIVSRIADLQSVVEPLQGLASRSRDFH